MPRPGATRALVLGPLGVPATADATQWDASVDLRMVGADAPTSYLDGGLGVLRYGDDRDGLQLGRARLAVAQDLGDFLTLRLDASAWGQHDKNPLDVTEAYLQLHPYPFGEAQELRTIGTEFKLEWLGTHSGHDFDVGAAVGVYGWNEGAGDSLTDSGFNITDWQGSLFGRVGLPSGLTGENTEYHQYDNRAGTYLGLDVHYLDRVTLEGLHYDNHANPAAGDEITGNYAWQTRFDTAGVRAEDEAGWTAILQWMAGETSVAPDEIGLLEWKFVTRYLLLSKRTGPHTFSVRYDDFKIDGEQAFPVGEQGGHALTAAYRFEPNRHWRFTLEGVRTRGFQANRAIFAGEAPFATESLVQLAIRYAVSNH